MKNVIIAGGGTGGHVYPALSIAKALQSLDKDLQIHFVGTPRGIEGRVIPENNFPLHFINIGRLNSNVSLYERIKTLFQLPFSILFSMFLLIRLRPKFVLGVGGYASAPILFTASLLGMRTIIWEPNSVPGLANRILSRFVNECWIVFEGAKKHLKSSQYSVVGIPVRSAIADLGKDGGNRESVRPFKNILIFGGSQGARGINRIVMEALEKNQDWVKDLKIVHQTGRLDFDEVSKRYENLKLENVEHFEFLNDMEKRYQWADLVVCRAGASTVAELAAAGKASLLIPFPGASDNHQVRNAQELANAKAALFVEQKDFTVEFLIEILGKLKNEPKAIRRLEENIRKFHVSNAALDMARKLVTH